MARFSQECDRLSRPIAVIFAIGGTFACRDWRLLLCGGAVVCALVWWRGVAHAYARFVTRLWLPLATALVVVWAGLVAAAPGQPAGSSRLAGLNYAIVIAARLAILSGLGQIVLLGVPASRLAGALRYYGIPRDLVVVAVAARTLVAELTLRLDQVWTARLARGVVSRRTPLQHALQLRHMLRPLLAWTLRSAVQRSELWTERSLLLNLDTHLGQYSQSRVRSGWYLAIAIAWVVASIASRRSLQ